ncbi:3'-5' exonuclease domain-containing protein 2 [Neisseriaceae bacterium JH1-16]|nr:3'-5' exonuclease domain-containing protein 2 [Neisseriaceae bacterium JH1-16]
MPITSRSHLSKDDIKTLPDYVGLSLRAVQVVGDAAALVHACAALRAAGTVGFDTESRPTFRKGEESEGPHLIQLASLDRAWLIPVAQHTDLAPLKALLESAEVLKVGFDLKSDRKRLRDKFGIECAGLVEVGELCREEGEHHTIGAVQAVARLFGQHFRKSKRVSTSNWASRVLSDAQQLYAANDAHVALRVYEALRSNGH